MNRCWRRGRCLYILSDEKWESEMGVLIKREGNRCSSSRKGGLQRLQRLNRVRRRASRSPLGSAKGRSVTCGGRPSEGRPDLSEDVDGERVRSHLDQSGCDVFDGHDAVKQASVGGSGAKGGTCGSVRTPPSACRTPAFIADPRADSAFPRTDTSVAAKSGKRGRAHRCRAARRQCCRRGRRGKYSW